MTDETCWFLAADFDKQSWQRDALAFVATCREKGVPAALERSRSGNGGHVWIFFSEPAPGVQIPGKVVTATATRVKFSDVAAAYSVAASCEPSGTNRCRRRKRCPTRCTRRDQFASWIWEHQLPTSLLLFSQREQAVIIRPIRRYPSVPDLKAPTFEEAHEFAKLITAHSRERDLFSVERQDHRPFNRLIGVLHFDTYQAFEAIYYIMR